MMISGFSLASDNSPLPRISIFTGVPLYVDTGVSNMPGTLPFNVSKGSITGCLAISSPLTFATEDVLNRLVVLL